MGAIVQVFGVMDCNLMSWIVKWLISWLFTEVRQITSMCDNCAKFTKDCLFNYLYMEKVTWLKETVPRDFRLQVFFHESVSLKPLIIPLGLFQVFFAQIRGEMYSQL